MARNERFPVPTSLLVAVIILLAWAAGGPAVASGPETVDFPGAVARALKNNADVSAAGYEWTSARKGAEAARGNYLPKLSLEERFVRTNVPAEAFALKLNEERLALSDFSNVDNFNKASPINDYITSFTIEQPVFAPHAYLGYEMARREAKAAGLDVSWKKEETVFQVLTAYLRVLTAKEFVAVARQGLSDAREHHRIAEVKEKAGTGLASDVLRARVFLASAESTKVTAESRFLLAQSGLGLAMGVRGGGRVDASGPIPPLPEAGTIEERIATVRANRSDLRAFSLRLANADTNVTLRKSEYLPTVGVMGAYQIDGQDGIFSPDNHTWKVGVGLTWNLFDGLRREAEVGRASAEKAKAREHYRGAEDLAAFQVIQAHLSVEEAARRVEIARAAVAAAEEGTRLVKSRYENQLARMIDLLDAQTALNGVRADLVRAQNDLQHSRAQLEYASGGLLSWALPGTDGIPGKEGGQ
ncbi:MAG: TolC family protein [Deltaproteobacteria bacterium]|nr:TolC family protein [Deltaproteobacteria bacterium]